jgi:hypothetical protein
MSNQINVKAKVQLSRCLINSAPSHEDACASGGIAPPFLTSALVEVSGQIPSQGALLPGKELQEPIV